MDDGNGYDATVLKAAALLAGSEFDAGRLRGRRRRPTSKNTFSPSSALTAAIATTRTRRKATSTSLSYSAVMKGGSSGAIVDAGNADASKLFKVTAHLEEPKMPPSGSKIPDKDLGILKAWINDGLIENPSGKAKTSNKPKMNLALAPGQTGKPTGPVAEPKGDWLLEPFVKTARTSLAVLDGDEPVGAAHRRRRSKAGSALQHEHLRSRRRAAVPRRRAQRRQVQPQRKPAPCGRRTAGQVRQGRSLERHHRRTRRGNRRRTRRDPRRRRQRRSVARRARRLRQARQDLLPQGRRTAPHDEETHRVGVLARVQPGRRAAGLRRPQRRPGRVGIGAAAASSTP